VKFFDAILLHSLMRVRRIERIHNINDPKASKRHFFTSHFQLHLGRMYI